MEHGNRETVIKLTKTFGWALSHFFRIATNLTYLSIRYSSILVEKYINRFQSIKKDENKKIKSNLLSLFFNKNINILRRK